MHTDPNLRTILCGLWYCYSKTLRNVKTKKITCICNFIMKIQCISRTEVGLIFSINFGKHQQRSSLLLLHCISIMTLQVIVLVLLPVLAMTICQQPLEMCFYPLSNVQVALSAITATASPVTTTKTPPLVTIIKGGVNCVVAAAAVEGHCTPNSLSKARPSSGCRKTRQRRWTPSKPRS